MIDILVILVLIFSFTNGLNKGAVRSFFSLVVLLIAIPITGSLYRIAATVLSFLPGENWQNFIGFFVTLAVVSLILHLVLLFPRMIIGGFLRHAPLSRLIGGAMSVFNSAVGWTVFALVIRAYPIFVFLGNWVKNSSTLNWLIANLSFVQTMLPLEFETVGVVLQGLSAIVRI